MTDAGMATWPGTGGDMRRCLGASAVMALVVWLAHGPDRWLDICIAGFFVGIPGLITMIVHDRHRRRRRALTHPEFRVTS